jgi:ABC-2 type transport system ATP-binding protein
MLAVEAVRKAHRGRTVLHGVTFKVEEGEIAALLGPNGAGKTTLLSVIAGLLRPDHGNVRVGGHDVVTARRDAARNIGLAPQETSVQRALTSRENLRFYAELYGVPRKAVAGAVSWAIEAMELGTFADRPAQHLSGGERRRLHAAIAVVGHPRLLLLDEPTVGSDVETRARLLALVRDLAAQGTAILYTTHYLPEVVELGARVMILDHGTLIADDPLRELLGEHATTTVELVFSGPAPQIRHRTATVSISDSVARVTGEPIAQITAEVLTSLGAAAAQLRAIEVLPGDLDSVFLSLTGRRYAGGEGTP